MLIIDEDRPFCEAITAYLTGFGYRVEVAYTGPAGLDKALTQPCLADEADEVAGLECDADDYLLKGGSARQLLARLHAITRRASLSPVNPPAEPATREITVAELRIVPDARRVTLDGRTLALTPSEYEILLALVKARGRVKTRDHLFAEIRDREYGVFDRGVDMQVSELRRKLGDDPRCPRFIRTVRSYGYMFIDPPRQPPTGPSSQS